MAQTPETRTVTPDQNAQSAKAQAAANQTVAAENAALTGMHSTARQGAEARSRPAATLARRCAEPVRPGPKQRA